MSVVEHFEGQLADYLAKYPHQLIVQTRTKSDLMLTSRRPGSSTATSVFIPKSLPTDVTRQSPLQTITVSDDFLSLLSRGVILLVIPHKGLTKFLTASDNRLRAITGRDKLDLATAEELSNVRDGSETQAEAKVSVLTITQVDRLNRIYAGELEYGTVDLGDSILLDCLLSCNDIEKAYIQANFKFPDVLSALWSDE